MAHLEARAWLLLALVMLNGCQRTSDADSDSVEMSGANAQAVAQQREAIKPPQQACLETCEKMTECAAEIASAAAGEARKTADRVGASAEAAVQRVNDAQSDVKTRAGASRAECRRGCEVDKYESVDRADLAKRQACLEKPCAEVFACLTGS